MTFLQTIRSTTSTTTLIKRLGSLPKPTSTTATTTTVLIRNYRGESGETIPRSETVPIDDAISQREEALLSIAVPRAQEIYDKHTSLPRVADVPRASLPPDLLVTPDSSSSSSSSSSEEKVELAVRKKRLVYRSKQRGWLEVDLLLGTWASQFVPTLDGDELDEFENFVNMETIDIYNVITLRMDVPEECKTEDGSGVVERIQEWARSSPLGKDPEGYEKVKKEHNLI